MIFIWGNRCRSVTGTHAVDKKLQVKEEEMQSMSTNRYEEAYEKIRLAREAVAAGNTALALSYIEEALALDPGNPDAWIEKMRAVGGTAEDPACSEIYAAGQNAIRCAGEDEAEIERLVYALYLVRAQKLMGIAEEKLAALKAKQETFREAAAEEGNEAEVSPECVSAEETQSGEVSLDEIKTLDALASKHALSLILAIPDEKMKAYPELVSVVGGCVSEYEKVSEMLTACLDTRGFELTDRAKETRARVLAKMRAKMV